MRPIIEEKGRNCEGFEVDGIKVWEIFMYLIHMDGYPLENNISESI